MQLAVDRRCARVNASSCIVKIVRNIWIKEVVLKGLGKGIQSLVNQFQMEM